MNNEINNNVNPNGVNQAGMGMPTGTVPTNNLPPQQPVYQIPPVATTTGMPQTGVVPPIAPQPVAPEPIIQGPTAQVPNNYVVPESQQPVLPQQVGNEQIMNPIPNNIPVSPMPGMPMAQPQNVGPVPTMGVPPMNGQMMPNGGLTPVGQTNNYSATDNPTGEKQKTPIAMIIITILVVVGVAVFLVLYLTGKINFGGSSNNSNPGEGTTVTDEPSDEIVLAEWMTYLLNQNLTEIKISRYVDADNSKVVNLTKEQLENLFNEMNGYNLVKYYSSSRIMPNDDLQITYTKDDANYSFTLSGENVTIGDDSNLKQLFENIDVPIEDDGQTSRDSEDYNYILKGYDTSIYDEYFIENEIQNNENPNE